ncbi:MAG: hypothetical protein JWM48_1088 [Mycobacterium sp.]|jgi:protocatechuate 4,5-dioxygenase alpha chain|nr:hypothetical protein [Mycobacterium sp.]
MSLTMLEKVLYDLGVDRGAKKAFREDADALLARYRLTADEVRLLRDFDLYELAARGVNPMLLMGYWRLSGESIPAYLGRIAAPLQPADPARDATTKERVS